MPSFTNIHGQEPSPAAPPEFGKPTTAQLELAKNAKDGMRTRLLPPVTARAGREGIDTTQCQAPTKVIGIGPRSVRSRCDRPATCVIVENNARPDGAIGGMALCDLCYKAISMSQPAYYAKMTPLSPEQSVKP